MVEDPILHNRWLNTLSYWENCGARKFAVADTQPKSKKKCLSMRQRNSRHAHMLKQQIHRLKVPYLHDYRLSSLLGGMNAYHYLDRLEISISRLLIEKGYEKR